MAIVPDIKSELFPTRQHWRDWLTANHEQEDELWLIYYKKNTGKESIKYDEAVEEALCFGWIDGKVRRIDEERYMQRYTPRKPGSVWSDLNKKRVKKMTREGKMTEAGLRLVRDARKTGKWQKAYSSLRSETMPDDFKKLLQANEPAWGNFCAFAKSYQNTYLYWINDAKRPETRERRMKKVLERALKNLKPGMM